MRTLRAVDVMPGETITALGAGDKSLTLDTPQLVVEHYRPFGLPDRVALTLANGQVIHANLGTPITVLPPVY